MRSIFLCDESEMRKMIHPAARRAAEPDLLSTIAAAQAESLPSCTSALPESVVKERQQTADHHSAE
jgi:hypothetical protein